MLNYIWGGMIVISSGGLCFYRQVEATAAAAVEGAGAAVEMCITLLVSCAFGQGLARIGERAGLVDLLAKVLRPLTRFLFPAFKAERGGPGQRGDEHGGQPVWYGQCRNGRLASKRWAKLHELNRHSSRASNAMCMFVVLNTASIQLVPTTLISLRQTYGSAEPGAVILPIWIVSLCALTVGITAAKLFERGAAAVKYISMFAVPVLIAGFILFGFAKRVSVYDCFVEGAKDGMKSMVRIVCAAGWADGCHYHVPRQRCAGSAGAGAVTADQLDPPAGGGCSAGAAAADIRQRFAGNCKRYFRQPGAGLCSGLKLRPL